MDKNIIPWRRRNQAPARNWSATPFDALHRQMNALFEDFFDDFGSARLPSLWGETGVAGVVTPSFEVTETADEIKVSAELPGMDEQDIDVSLEDNVLTVKGEKREERDEKEKGYHFSERRYGSFQRSIPLSAGVKEDEVSARFKKGVLTVRLPKSEEAREKGRSIEIEAE